MRRGMAPKAIVMGAVFLLLLSAMALPSAALPDDTLSLTFPSLRIAGAKGEGHGLGWYDSHSSPPKDCIVIELQLMSRLRTLDDLWSSIIPLWPSPLLLDNNSNGMLFLDYYENLRVQTNSPGFGLPFGFPFASSEPVSFPCPRQINEACQPTYCPVHLERMHFTSAMTVASQDGRICNRFSSFTSCIATSSKWWVDRCPWDFARFQARAPFSDDGAIYGTGFDNLAFSQDIDCSNPPYGPRYAGLGYDYSFLLGGDDNWLSSGQQGIPVAAVVPFNDGQDSTGFFVSCLQVTYTTVDSSTPVPTVTPGNVDDGVDWFLVLDLDAISLKTATTSWNGALARYDFGADGQALAGLYDYGGDNDCDFARSPAPECSNGHDEADPEVDFSDTLSDEQDGDCWQPVGAPGAEGYRVAYNPTGRE
jgi:hypothetical protein